MVNHVRECTGLCEFIDASPSPFHVCVTVAQRLSAAGFTELSERDEWPARAVLHRAGRLAGRLAGTATPDAPFRIVGAHTDSPNLRVKQHPDRFVSGWQVVALEPYGGAWLNSWLDRDLGISGRLSVRVGNDGIEHRAGAGSTSRSCGCRSWPSTWPRTARRCRSTRSGTSTRSGASAAAPRSFLGYVAEQAGRRTRTTSSAST